jgi:hypothetical protein
MRNRNSTPMGALHPVLFFAGVYVVALLFSIFICSSLFYSCQSRQTDLTNKNATPATDAVALANTGTGVILR